MQATQEAKKLYGNPGLNIPQYKNNDYFNPQLQQTFTRGQIYNNPQPQQQSYQICKKHSDLTNFVCFTCYQKICQVCFQEHQGHSIQQESTAFQQLQQQVQSQNPQEVNLKLQQIRQLKQLYLQNIQQMDIQFKVLQSQVDGLKQQIKDEMVKDFQNKASEFQKFSNEHKTVIQKQQKHFEKILQYSQQPQVYQYSSLDQLIQHAQNYEAANTKVIDSQVQYKYDIKYNFDQQVIGQIQNIIQKSVTINVSSQGQNAMISNNNPPQTYQQQHFHQQPSYSEQKQVFNQNVPQNYQPQLQPNPVLNNKDIQVSVQTLIQNGLTENDLNGINQTIQILQQLDAQNIDLVKVCKKYKTYNKDPQEAAVQYSS